MNLNFDIDGKEGIDGVEDTFNMFREMVEKLDDETRITFNTYAFSTLEDHRRSDGPLAFLILTILEKNITLNKELDEIKIAHNALMNLYADKNL